MEVKEMYWLEEIGQEYNNLVGKKCANLGEVTKIGLPVPRGFALSVKAEERFLRETNVDRKIKQFLAQRGGKIQSIKEFEEVSQALRQIMETQVMPQDMREAIVLYYDLLCEQCGVDAAVSVRSAGTVSHPGQYETYLNVKGRNEVLRKVVRVWSSIYNARTLAALNQKELPAWDSPPIGVCILGMVDAKAAGVCFTVDPTTGDEYRMMIEANLGLGESVVSGAGIPDRFIVDKQDLKVIEKCLGRKEKWVIATDKGVVHEEIPLSEQSKLCLEDQEISKICELSKRLESHFGIPQDVEWAVDKSSPAPNNIVILQTRPQVGIPEKKTATDKILDGMIDLLKFS
jgi:pyruvate,water dikinase